MTAKTTTERQQTLKAKRKAEGLERLELWVKPEHKEDIKQYAAKQRQAECKHTNTVDVQRGVTFVRLRCVDCGKHIEHTWD